MQTPTARRRSPLRRAASRPVPPHRGAACSGGERL